MRVLLVSLVAVLVACTTTNSQFVEGPQNLVDVVNQAINQIIAETDIALADVIRQRDLAISSYEYLTVRVGVTGPIPAVLEIIKYWHINLLRFAQSVVDKTESIFASIIAGIHDKVQELTQCSVEDANELIAGTVQRFEVQFEVVRKESSARLEEILLTTSAIAIRLHELALQDCGGHLVQLNNKLTEIWQLAFEKLRNEWVRRHAGIRNVIVVNLKELIIRIQQLGSRPVPLPAIDPPTCSRLY